MYVCMYGSETAHSVSESSDGGGDAALDLRGRERSM